MVGGLEVKERYQGQEENLPLIVTAGNGPNLHAGYAGPFLGCVAACMVYTYCYYNYYLLSMPHSLNLYLACDRDVFPIGYLARD